MSLNLPERASYEYLKKLAKDRLESLRKRSPSAKLADAQLAVAREYGFSSWRALKSEIDRRDAPHVAEFMRACRTGDADAMRALLAQAPDLVRERLAGGATGLHLASQHPEAVRLLLAHGADPNMRDVGDNATALHFAAGAGSLESVRLLLDARADVHGAGDLHEADVIGWAARKGNDAIVALLLDRGARHHVFSAMALGDRDLVQRLVERDADCLLRRRSKFENRQTPVHFAFAPPDGLALLPCQPDYAMLALLIELGADLEATDDRGRTPLAVALLRHDDEAARLLRAAGAKEPPEVDMKTTARQGMAAAAKSVKEAAPMFRVPDVRATVEWYRAIGFTVHDEYEDSGELVYARMTFGDGQFTLTAGSTTGPRDVSLWFYTNQVQELYELLKQRHLRFDEDLYTPFYGGRQFSVQDLNGLPLIFWQPEWIE
jgi:ankyrin repeat protein/catechol 2,3-dioxygenase-like lactoylglutathione lyase family enzyme